MVKAVVKKTAVTKKKAPKRGTDIDTPETDPTDTPVFDPGPPTPTPPQSLWDKLNHPIVWVVAAGLVAVVVWHFH
jgi:hypothetical protein